MLCDVRGVGQGAVHGSAPRHMPTDVCGTTPLIFASLLHHTECVAEMLRLGADARRVDNDGWTALHWVAAWADRGGDGVGVVRQLVAAGCDAAVRDNDGHTAVELARTCYGGAEWATEIEGWVAAAMV